MENSLDLEFYYAKNRRKNDGKIKFKYKKKIQINKTIIIIIIIIVIYCFFSLVSYIDFLCFTLLLFVFPLI